MAIKDRPLVFLISSCAICISATWVVSEKIRVDPIKQQLSDELMHSKSAPKISDITVSKIQNEDGQRIEKNIYFSDPEGDARYINHVVTSTNAKDLSIYFTKIGIPADEQKTGTNYVATWDCGPESYYVKFRLLITDDAANVSLPYDYTINCNL